MDSKHEINFDHLVKQIGLSTQDFPIAALYVVGLPIGNLADISLRALWVLNHSDVIAAEDTRQTKKLLDKFNISASLLSVHQHNEREGAQKILSLLEEGKRVAMVTDAGTPAISDPGTKVVREVTEAGFKVIPVPGSSAVITAVSAAGMEPEGFIFHGFLQGGSAERQKELLKLKDTKRTFVLYEAPHRIKKLCAELEKCGFEPEQRIVIARELTKKFETIYSLTAAGLPDWASSHEAHGEYVVIVNAQPKEHASELDETTKKWLKAVSAHFPPKELARLCSEVAGCSKKDAYDYLLSLKQDAFQ